MGIYLLRTNSQEFLSNDNLILIAFGVVLFLFLGTTFILGLYYERGRENRLFKSRLSAAPSRVVRQISLITNTLNASLNYQRVLEVALDLSANTIGKTTPLSSQMFSFSLLFQRDHLKIHSSRRLTHSDLRISLPAKRGVLRLITRQGEPELIQNPSSDPELGQIVTMQECKAAYCIPLRSGLDVFGVLVFAHPREDYFSKENLEILEIIAGQANVALLNARLFKDLETEKNRIAETQEGMRKKLARDLHDGPTQSVSAIAMQANYTRRLIDKNPEEAKNELKKIEELARRTTKEIRHMLFTLRPLVLESQGLEAGLQTMADKLQETFEQNVQIKMDPEIIAQLDEYKQSIVFFIVEEAVNNARKHALANNIWVRLKRGKQGLGILDIQDDGMGFDVVSVETTYGKRGSLGLINLRERTEMLNGIIDIKSVPGEGTKVQVIIPLTEEAIDHLRHKSV